MPYGTGVGLPARTRPTYPSVPYGKTTRGPGFPARPHRRRVVLVVRSVLRTKYGESDLRSFAGDFMIPEGAGEGTVLKGSEEFIEGSEVSHVRSRGRFDSLNLLREFPLPFHAWQSEHHCTHGLLVNLIGAVSGPCGTFNLPAHIGSRPGMLQVYRMHDS